MPRSISAATGLHPTLAFHVVNTLGWTALRPLQRDALGPVLCGDDALLLALREDNLLLATGALLGWPRGFVEPVAAPPARN